ncbi:hypothetical protein C0J52_07433 [Blattella germanica]|nr:hypothetical protein C0J52_07433 [Blattella germanica]
MTGENRFVCTPGVMWIIHQPVSFLVDSAKKGRVIINFQAPLSYEFPLPCIGDYYDLLCTR